MLDISDQMIRGLQAHGKVPAHLLNRVPDLDAKRNLPPKYEEWKKATEAGVIHPRSSRLKRVDKAVSQYEKLPSHRTQKELRFALRDWVRWKGDGWKTSRRNKNHVVEILRVTVETGWGPPLTRSEIEALKVLEKERRLTLQRLFQNRPLVLRKDLAVNEIRKAHSKLKTAKKGISQLSDAPAGDSSGSTSMARQVVHNMLGDLLDSETLTAILPELGQSFVGEMVSSMVPFVSQITSGAKALGAWGSAGKARHAEYKNKKHGYIIEKGDPAVAFDALQRCMERDVTRKVTTAGIQTADFGAKLGTTFVDGGAISGPVIGAATALGKLAQQIFLVGRDYQEAQSANKLVENHNLLDMQLFERCPVLGCYMLLCSSTSDVLNLTSVGFARTWDWQSEAHQVIKEHIWPIQKVAAKYIRNARYYIPDLATRAPVDSVIGRGLGYL